MNILEHILAGHYPVDGKGRPLVPTNGGGTFTVLATDAPCACPIVGYYTDSGRNFAYWPDTKDLLPPPPRTIEVSRWFVVNSEGSTLDWTADESSVSSLRRAYQKDPSVHVIELTGEFVEEWPA